MIKSWVRTPDHHFYEFLPNFLTIFPHFSQSQIFVHYCPLLSILAYCWQICDHICQDCWIFDEIYLPSLNNIGTGKIFYQFFPKSSRVSITKCVSASDVIVGNSGWRFDWSICFFILQNFKWVALDPVWPKTFPQYSHEYGFSPVWLRSWA